MKKKYILSILSIFFIVSIVISSFNFVSSDSSNIKSNELLLINQPKNSNGNPIPIENYTIHSEINEGETKEFNVSTSNLITINLAFLIFKDNIFQKITNITLNKKPLDNIFYKNIEFQNLTVGNYSVWYGLQDDLGNSNTTQPFGIEIKSSKYPYPFRLVSSAETIDDDGSFLLAWSESKNALNFTIYYSTRFINISKMNAIKIKEGFTGFSHYCTAFANGKHFFIIFAFSPYGNISSNYIEINIILDDIDLDTDDTDDETHNLTWVWGFLAVAGILIGGFIVIYIVKRVLKKKDEGFGKNIKFIKSKSV